MANSRIIIGLSRVHPLIYLASYLLAIPMFGVLFHYWAPHDFYAPYAQFEPAAQEDRAEIAKGIVRAIRQTARATPDRKLVISDWEIKLDSISARDVSAMSDGALTFKVRFDADGVGGRAASLLGNFHLSVTLPTYPFTRETSKEGVVTNYFPSLDAATPTGSYPIDPRKAFDLIFQGPDASFLAPVLRVDLETNGAILRYLSGVKGDPSGISGQFGRMLYFSAVVMTTLGLGDIVPMTARSRGLVAAEAIFGITFAGLFINALAYQASMPRKP